MSQSFRSRRARCALTLVFAVTTAVATSAFGYGASAQALPGQVLGYAPEATGAFAAEGAIGNAPPAGPATSEDVLPERLRRAVVSYRTHEAPGTIIIDTGHTTLYYVLGDNRAIRYGVGVGREGFTWSGVKSISRKAEWPDWHPPAEMIARQPYLPRFMAGGPGNPLGARAMYLGSSEYRIHGTNDPTTIGKFVSSGCIRLTNEDVEDLFNRVQVGAKVIVLPKSGSPRLEAHRRPAATVASRDRAQPRRLVASLPERQAMNPTTSGLY